MPLRPFYRLALYSIPAIFFVLLLVLAGSIVEISRLRLELAGQKQAAEKAAAEHRSRDRNVASLSNEIGQLRAQKALYTATIETLAKKEGPSN